MAAGITEREGAGCDLKSESLTLNFDFFIAMLWTSDLKKERSFSYYKSHIISFYINDSIWLWDFIIVRFTHFLSVQLLFWGTLENFCVFNDFTVKSIHSCFSCAVYSIKTLSYVNESAVIK